MSTRSTTAKALVALAALTAGVAVGAATERLATRRLRQGAGLGPRSTRGTQLTVRTDDGIDLAVVVEEPIENVEAAPTVVFTHGYALSLDSWPDQRVARRVPPLIASAGTSAAYSMRSHPPVP